MMGGSIFGSPQNYLRLCRLMCGGSVMDRPLPVPVNRARARLKRYALTAAVLMAVVFGVGSLPLAFLYFRARAALA
jgi:hypothetical protein